MIEFQGELPRKCKQVLKKRFKFFGIWLSVFVGVTLSFPFIILGIIFKDILIILILLICGIIFATLVNLFTFLLKIDENLNMDIPTRVTIENETIEKEGEGDRNYAIRQLTDVKKVIDVGDWYEIKFYFPNKCGYCICHKELLVKGSIEEFEELFDEIIERKI